MALSLAFRPVGITHHRVLWSPDFPLAEGTDHTPLGYGGSLDQRPPSHPVPDRRRFPQAAPSGSILGRCLPNVLTEFSTGESQIFCRGHTPEYSHTSRNTESGYRPTVEVVTYAIFLFAIDFVSLDNCPGVPKAGGFERGASERKVGNKRQRFLRR